MGFLIKLDDEGIDRQIEKLEKSIASYKSMKSLLKNSIEELEAKEDKSLNEIIILMYLKLQSVVDVAARLNDEGMRIQTDSRTGQRKYNSNDITQIVYYDQDNSSKCFKIARLFNKYNSKLLSEKEFIRQLLLIKD